MKRPIVLNPPERIFLCYGDLDGADLKHEDADEVLWSTDDEWDNRVEYRLVRPSRHKRKVKGDKP